MRRAVKNLFGIIIFIVFIASVSCNSFGDPKHKINGVVRDNQAQSIEGATVALERIDNGEMRKVDLDKTTKIDGNFEFSIIGSVPADLKLTVKKDGFKTFEKQISAEQSEIIVMLQPKTE